MVLILSGPVHGGKTTFLERALPRWKGRGLSLSGFLSPAVTDGDGERGYDLLEVKDGRRQPFLRRGREPEGVRIGPFAFIPAALERARSIIRDATARDLLVVDEVGPLELGGGGLWPALGETIGRPDRKALIVVREDILEEVIAALAPIEPSIFDVRDPRVQQLLEGSLFETAKRDDGQS